MAVATVCPECSCENVRQMPASASASAASVPWDASDSGLAAWTSDNVGVAAASGTRLHCFRQRLRKGGGDGALRRGPLVARHPQTSRGAAASMPSREPETVTITSAIHASTATLSHSGATEIVSIPHGNTKASVYNGRETIRARKRSPSISRSRPSSPSSGLGRRPPSPSALDPAVMEAVKKRVKRVQNARLYLLQQPGPNTFLVGGDFPEHKYRVVIGPQTCSCGRGPHCLHLLFVMLRVFQVPENDPRMYMKELKNYEVETLFQHYQQRRNSRVSGTQGEYPKEPSQIKHAQRCVPSNVDSSNHSVLDTPTFAERKYIEEELCPICLLEMTDGESLVVCTSGCRNKLHLHCMAIWAAECKHQGEQVLCPLCRQPWNDENSTLRISSHILNIPKQFPQSLSGQHLSSKVSPNSALHSYDMFQSGVIEYPVSGMGHGNRIGSRLGCDLKGDSRPSFGTIHRLVLSRKLSSWSGTDTKEEMGQNYRFEMESKSIDLEPESHAGPQYRADFADCKIGQGNVYKHGLKNGSEYRSGSRSYSKIDHRYGNGYESQHGHQLETEYVSGAGTMKGTESEAGSGIISNIGVGTGTKVRTGLKYSTSSSGFGSESESKSEFVAGTSTGSGSDHESGSWFEAETEIKAKTECRVETGTGIESGSKSETEVDIGIQTGTESKIDLEPQSISLSAFSCECNSKSDIEPVSQSESGTETRSKSGNELEPQCSSEFFLESASKSESVLESESKFQTGTAKGFRTMAAGSGSGLESRLELGHEVDHQFRSWYGLRSEMSSRLKHEPQIRLEKELSYSMSWSGIKIGTGIGSGLRPVIGAGSGHGSALAFDVKPGLQPGIGSRHKSKTRTGCKFKPDFIHKHGIGVGSYMVQCDPENTNRLECGNRIENNQCNDHNCGLEFGDRYGTEVTPISDLELPYECPKIKHLSSYKRMLKQSSCLTINKGEHLWKYKADEHTESKSKREETSVFKSIPLEHCQTSSRCSNSLFHITDVSICNAGPIPAEHMNIASEWIKVFGVDFVSCLYSRDWKDREMALQGLLNCILSVHHYANEERQQKVTSCCANILAMMIADPVFKVYLGCVHCIRVLVKTIASCHNNIYQLEEFKELIKPIIRSLLKKCADRNRRTSHLSAEILIELAKGQNEKVVIVQNDRESSLIGLDSLELILSCVLENFTLESVHWQWLTGRLLMLNTLLQMFPEEFCLKYVPLYENESGYKLNNFNRLFSIIEFSFKAIQSSHSTVSKLAKHVFVLSSSMTTAEKGMLNQILEMISELDANLQLRLKKGLYTAIESQLQKTHKNSKPIHFIKLINVSNLCSEVIDKTDFHKTSPCENTQISLPIPVIRSKAMLPDPDLKIKKGNNSHRFYSSKKSTAKHQNYSISAISNLFPESKKSCELTSKLNSLHVCNLGCEYNSLRSSVSSKQNYSYQYLENSGIADPLNQVIPCTTTSSNENSHDSAKTTVINSSDCYKVMSKSPCEFDVTCESILDTGQIETLVRPSCSSLETKNVEDTNSKSYVEDKQWKRGPLLGTGAYSVCYQAWDVESGTLMAVKQVPYCRNSEEEQSCVEMRIRREIMTMSKLRHPNILRILGATREGSHFNIFVEWMAGGSVANILDNYGPFSQYTITEYTRQILQGLKYLHENHILHRDLKGANLLVDSTGKQLRIGDFGAAAWLESQSTISGEFQGQLLGTIAFMAPEVLRGGNYGRSCDVWSVGCCMIEMATTKAPWKESQMSNHLALMYKIASSKDPPFIPDSLGPATKDLALKCLQLNSELRPTAKELLNHHCFHILKS